MKFTIKKFLLFVFVLMEMSLSMVLAKPAEPVAPFTSGEFLRPKVSISFTIARRRDCDGFGICDIDISIVMRTLNKENGVLYQDESTRNMLVLEIDKANGITAECYAKYFKSGVFVMEDDFPVSSEITRALEIAGAKTIPAGRHRIIEKNGIISVYLPVK